MATIDKTNWQAAADLLSRVLHGQPARLEVASLSIGDQIEAEWGPLLGISYDPKDDLFDIQLQGVDHLVRHPRLFAIRERDSLADGLLVVDGEGAEHIVQLREPVALPPTPDSD
jgi:hypothetical protein